MQPTLTWQGDVDGHLDLLDQTLLPHDEVVLQIQDLPTVIDAIRRLAVRGAPAIGVAAAYGMVLGVRNLQPKDPAAFHQALHEVGEALAASRPTAVNLAWAVSRMQELGREKLELSAMLLEAHAICQEDKQLCLNMGKVGAELIQDGMTVLTHCNAGRLATAGDGTALAVMFAAHRQGKKFRVLADETRPLLQGSRLTALELMEEGIPVDVIADSAAAGLMARGEVDIIFTGADRVAANGDAANKVGTYGLALAAQAHDVPMYIVAPVSTFDLQLAHGGLIPIEERNPLEVLAVLGRRVAASGVGARNPAFDVTPATLLRGLVTDRGLISPVNTQNILAMMGS